MKLAALVVALAAWPAFAQAPDADARAAALRKAFEDAAETGFSGAVLVTAGNATLLDAACGLADRAHGRVNRTDTIFDVGSITKQFTATAILQLEEQHKLATGDTLARFFEGVPDDKKRIQLHHLLTHTSGLPPDIPVGSATVERDELVRAALAAKPESKPGEKFVYNNVGYMLLGAVVELASGERYEDYVAKHLFAPAGMRSSGFLRTDGVDTSRTACGYEGRTPYGPAEKGWYSWGLRGCGGVLSTTGDLLAWSKALESDAVLSKHSREKLFAPFLLDYAYGWWVRTDSVLGRVISHGGTTRGFEAQFARYVDGDLRVIVLCNERGRSEALARDLALLALGKREAHPEVALEPRELEACAGKYALAIGGTLTVEVDGNALVLEPDQAAVVAALTGAAATKLADDARLKQRAQSVIDALAAGDAEAAQALLSKQWPGWNRVMVRTWREWLDARGKLERVEVLGSHGSTETLVRLVHERRSVFWLLRWKDDVLNGWSVDAGLPENAHYRARSASSFAFRSDEGSLSDEFVLDFERDAAGAVRALRLTSPLLHWSARRAK